MPDVNPYSVKFLDTDGDHAKASMWVAAGTSISNPTLLELTAALDAVSTASIYSHQVVHDATYPGADAVDGPYDVADKAVFQFRDADGHVQQLVIPAPDRAIFASDDETINELHALAATVIVKSLAILASNSGAPLVSYLKGYRSRRQRSAPNLRRF